MKWLYYAGMMAQEVIEITVKRHSGTRGELKIDSNVDCENLDRMGDAAPEFLFNLVSELRSILKAQDETPNSGPPQEFKIFRPESSNDLPGQRDQI
jgi:hypothetical protein